MKTLPVAVQVYSVREDAEKDFAGTMKKIKEIGYDGVELAGLYGLEPAAIKAAIEDAGLVALSAHVPFQELVADMEGTIQKYVEIGMKYIAIPYLMEEDRPGTPKFDGNVKLFAEIAKACKAKGIQLLYHNHDFEFQKMADEYNIDLETVKKYLQAEQVKDQLKSQKAIAVVVDSATAVKAEKKPAKKTAKKAEDAEGEEATEEKPAKTPTRKKADEDGEEKKPAKKATKKAAAKKEEETPAESK